MPASKEPVDEFGGNEDEHILFKKLLDELSYKFNDWDFPPQVERTIMLFYVGEVRWDYIATACADHGQGSRAECMALVKSAVINWRTDRLSQQLFKKIGGMKEWWRI